MAPEYGATCGIFPIDGEALSYLRLSGRSEDQIALVEAYAKARVWHAMPMPQKPTTATCSNSTWAVKPSLAGPKRPQDRVLLEGVPSSGAYRE
jgi:aconitate hydratase